LFFNPKKIRVFTILKEEKIMGLDVDISFNDVFGISFSAGEILLGKNAGHLSSERIIALMGIVSVAQQNLNLPKSSTDVVLKLSDGILGYARIVTAYAFGQAVTGIFRGVDKDSISIAGYAAALMIVLNRSLALMQNKINTYFNADKA
jgi:hypothetical protein